MINIIVLNIVFGVIIDTFGEMRDKSYEKQEKLDNTCLVCLNSKSEINEAGVEFKDHIYKHHNIWLYLKFMKYLLEKCKLEIKSQEVYILEDIRVKSVEWMPLRTSLYLEAISEGETDLLDHIQKKLDSMESRQEEIYSCVESVNEILKGGDSIRK